MVNIIDCYLDDLQNSPIEDTSYETYCEVIDLVFNNDHINEGLFDDIRKMQLSRELVNVFKELKYELSKISKEFNINLSTMVIAFRQKEAYNVLRAFGFNIRLIVKAFFEFTDLIHAGLLAVFREIYKSKDIQRLRSGVMKVDEFLNKYPILKKITGVAVAGILLYIWLNMTFIGNLDYDFNFTSTLEALQGSFNIADLFMSPEGLMLMTLFGSGFVFGLSVPWLGKSLYNLTLAIVYTIYARLKGKDKTFKDTVERFKRKIKRDKLK